MVDCMLIGHSLLSSFILKLWNIPLLQNYKKGLKSISYDILGVFLLNVLTKRRIWDMFDQSEAILGGSNEQILLTQ